MPTIATTYGPIQVLASSVETFPSGAIRSCIASEPATLRTPYGDLTPQYSADTLRKRQLPSITFYRNGMLRVLPLEQQEEVRTPAAALPAEQITFYEDGAVRRVFPLNGRLSGFWSQEDEAQLSHPVKLNTPLGVLELNIVSAYFSPKGALRSLTLWPGEILEVPSPCGKLSARTGLSFYDTGEIKSLEPATPTSVATPIGKIRAFNPDVTGICGDANSLRFSRQGEIVGLACVANAFVIAGENEQAQRIAPPLRRNACDGETLEPAPLFLEFEGDRVSFSAEGMAPCSANRRDVSVTGFIPPLPRLNAGCTARTMW
ncbi:MAG: hypothetical protein AB7D07_11675 [Desulfovibrionaceae bacterium]